MTTATFDTLTYFEKLKAVGVPDDQAKVQVEVMHSLVKSYDEAVRKELATKGDLQDLKVALRGELQGLRSELKSDVQETKHELLKWMMGMFLAQTAMLIAVIAFIK